MDVNVNKSCLINDRRRVLGMQNRPSTIDCIENYRFVKHARI